MNRITQCMASVGLLAVVPVVHGQVSNLKVVTDANPDYSDMASLTHSITSRWATDKDKMWALFYWNHIARRQTSPMWLHGFEVTDPIRQFNDYGFTQCSTISGVSASIWDFMGHKSRYYEIGRHTVCEVFYDNGWHEYDSSLSAMYTLCDGKTVAGVRDIGAEGACAASGGKVEQGHIAKYHCVNATSTNGFLEGSDWMRSLQSEADSFHPNNIKHQYFYKDADYGHRYILNLRPGENYTRAYRKLGETADYYVLRESANRDLELANPRYRIRGNGTRVWDVPLTHAALPAVAYSMKDIRALDPMGVEATGADGEIIFKVEGANVITSMDIAAAASAGAKLSVSTSNGMAWKELALGQQADSGHAKLHLHDEVTGAYEVLVKVSLPERGRLNSIRFDTVTQLNSKTQPRLNIGRNTVYVGAGDPTESIVIWPDLRDGRNKPYLVQSDNIVSDTHTPSNPSFSDIDIHYPILHLEDPAVPKGYAIFRVDAPQDITSFTYGGRFGNRAPGSQITLFHSFDEGKTWQQTWQLTDTSAPWDVVHHETIRDVPAGTRSILFKYHLFSYESAAAMCGVYGVRIEANHKLAAAGAKPVEVTFNWSERQADYSLVERSHTQLVTQFPSTYTIDVGGADHPIVNSLRVNSQGAAGPVVPGYSDGKVNANSQKWMGTWATYGKNLAEGKPYTCSIPSSTNWDAGDPNLKKLTDGVVGSGYTGGKSFSVGGIWPEGQNPEIVVDLGEPQSCAAFRVHLHGYPGLDAILGEIKDQVEVLTSTDGKQFASQGLFDLNLRWKDVPANFMWTDEETFKAHNFTKVLPQPMQARYVKYKLTPKRMLGVTEVQVLDSVKFEPFDLKIALPKDAPK